MECVHCRNKALSSCLLARKLDCRLHCLGAGIAEEYPAAVPADGAASAGAEKLHEPLHQPASLRICERLLAGDKRARLLGDCLHYSRVRMPEYGNAHARGAVNVALALNVPDEFALPALERNAALAVEVHLVLEFLVNKFF